MMYLLRKPFRNMTYGNGIRGTIAREKQTGWFYRVFPDTIGVDGRPIHARIRPSEVLDNDLVFEQPVVDYDLVA